MQGMTVAARFTVFVCGFLMGTAWLVSARTLRAAPPSPPQPIQVRQAKPLPFSPPRRAQQPTLPPIIPAPSKRPARPQAGPQATATPAAQPVSEPTKLPPILKPEDFQRVRTPDSEPTLRPAPKQTELEKPADDGPPAPLRPLESTPPPSPPAENAKRPDKGNTPETKPTDAPGPIHDVRAATFQSITPGTTSTAKLLEVLGEPTSKEGDQQREWIYSIPKFHKVVFVIRQDVVDSAVIHLTDAVQESQIAKQLGFAHFEPVDLPDHQGQVIATAYPERGVILHRDSAAAGKLIRQIILRPISAELFLARAEQPGRINFDKMLADIEYAQKLDPKNGHAYWLHAELLARIGRPALGAAAAERAVLQNPRNLRYQLTYADLLGQIGGDLEALTLTKKIRDAAPPQVLERAIAENQMGHWTAFGRRANYTQAIEHHRSAIDLAQELLADASSIERQEIWQLLIDAHCATALAFAAAATEDSMTRLQTSLEDAQRIVDNLPNLPNLTKSLQRKIDDTQLNAAIHTQQEIDLEPIATRVAAAVTEITQLTADDIYSRHTSYQTGLTLYSLAVLAKGRAPKEDVQSYIEAACTLQDQGSPQRDKTSEYQYQRARSLYFAGAVQALLFDDHAAAVIWYDQAMEFMKTDLPRSQATDLSLQGDRLVRMGVSYWHGKRHNTAIRVTRAGMKMIEDAVKREWVERDALSIPYGNLAAMYGQVGDAVRAKKYDQLAAEFSD